VSGAACFNEGMISRAPLFLSFLAALVGLAAACSGSVSGPLGADGGGADGGGGGDGSITDAPAGGDLFPADTTKVVVTSKGGFGAGAPDGSTCSQEDRTYTLTLPARTLDAKVCASSTTGGPNAYVIGKETLTEDEYAPIATALRAVHLSTEAACGADKPAETLTITTPSAETRYDDDFYSCNKEPGRIYVKGIDEVLNAVITRGK